MGGKTDEEQVPVITGQRPLEWTAPDGSLWPNEGAYNASVEATRVADLAAGHAQAAEDTQQAADAANLQVAQDRAASVASDIQTVEDMRVGSQNLVSTALTDPASLTTPAEVAKVQVTPDQQIAVGTGQTGPAAQATTTQATPAANIVTPDTFTTATVTPSEASGAASQALQGVSGATGQVDSQALVQAIQKDPSSLAQLGLDPAQIDQITQIISPSALQVGAGELVSGSAVDMARVQAATDVQAAQADPSNQATVKGQLETLYQDFEGANPPAWAAGAMRGATAKMAARGLGASSMAGQAIVQAAMESALPIAMADAQVHAGFEAQNLTNRQQTAMFAAEQRAKFLGLEFTQEFQSRVQNAGRIADIANMNFTAEQQIAIENGRIASSADLANLSSRSAKVLADAAAMSQLDLTNLSNAQQAAVQNAQSFMQMDLTNLNNNQQTNLFKAQAMQQAILSDTAAANAAYQFNAASENQTNQFMANLTSQTQQFNASQQNAMEQFNTNEANAISQFNTSQSNARDQFNAQNSLIIAQANTKWRQDVATMDTAAQNEANMEGAKTANAFTAKSLDQLWQRERDIMDYAYKSSESAKDRALSILLTDKQVAENDKARAAEESAALGGLFTKLLFGGLG